MAEIIDTNLVVLGGGPAGYSAAFRAADLGLDVVLVERESTLGGVCLNVGCIPSKALLHVAKGIKDAQALSAQGVDFGKPAVDLGQVRFWKEKITRQLTTGLDGLAKKRDVRVVNGLGQFTGTNELCVQRAEGEISIRFQHAVIAVGSRPIQLPFIPQDDPRVWDSSDALELKAIPPRLLLMGGGIIGLEMGMVYQALGSQVEVVEMLDQVIPAADPDVVKLFTRATRKVYQFRLETKVTAMEARSEGVVVSFEAKDGTISTEAYDAILVAIGRTPNGALIGAERAGVGVSDEGFIKVDAQLRTNVPHIFAVGDVTGHPMLAHKGTHAGRVAAEVIAKGKGSFRPRAIPSIAYTDPEVAWVGITEKEAQAAGLDYEATSIPWAASGRAVAAAVPLGMTKLIWDKASGRVLGGALVGSNAGELLGEIGLAIELNATAADLARTIHAHPTLNESIGLAAELFEGTITDLPNPKASDPC